MTREDAKNIVSRAHPDRIICSSQELNNGYVFFTKLPNMSEKQVLYWNEAWFIDGTDGKISPFDMIEDMDLLIETENTSIYY
ncbi:MAG: hypothetical protein IKG47_03935 [Oscillospiraceae bacterium]|nr:hypothetical protein [Oscillospiraceae bacterium]